MEVDPKMKFVCKVCNKRYPCGKSLGGHLRSHNRALNSSQEHEKSQSNQVKILTLSGGRNIKGDSGSYGLRENPKRTRRFVDSSSTSMKEKFCKECGKSFLTLKALCGHMACHSEKERGINKFEENLGYSEKHKLVKDSQSDTETSNPRGRRSMRYKAIDLFDDVGEIEQEQEEVAMCLMMLSMDSGYKKSSNSEYSDNNSVNLEAKSSSIDMRITRNTGEFVGMKNSAEIDLSDNSDSGYFRNGPKKVESDVSADWFGKKCDFKKLEEENGSEFEDIDAEFGESLSRFKRAKPELEKNYLMNCNLRKTAKIGSNRPDIGAVGCKKTSNGSAIVEVCKSAQKRSFGSRDENGKNTIAQDFSGYAEKRLGFKRSKRHECPICFRVFRSGQALGGHKRSHFLGGSEGRTIVIKQELPKTPALLDLNLPAPMEHEANEDALFMPW